MSWLVDQYKNVNATGDYAPTIDLYPGQHSGTAPDFASGSLGDFGKLSSENYSDLNSWLDHLYRLYQNGDVAAGEKLFNYYATEQSAKTARDWTAEREDTQYQRLMSDLEKAGISPYILTGATPSASSSSGSSYSGSQMASQESSKRSKDSSIISAILRALGLVALGTVRALV